MTGPRSSGNMASEIVSVESVDVIDGTDFEEVMKERNRVSHRYCEIRLVDRARTSLELLEWHCTHSFLSWF